MAAEGLRDKLDHPLTFAFAITFVVLGMSALITWFAKSRGWAGLASLAQHP